MCLDADKDLLVRTAKTFSSGLYVLLRTYTPIKKLFDLLNSVSELG